MPLTEKQETYLGIIGRVNQNIRTPFLDLFAGDIAPLPTTKISYDHVVDDTGMADLVMRGSTGKILTGSNFGRYELIPGVIDEEVPVTPEELVMMDAGDTVYYGGKAVKTGTIVAERKAQVLKNRVARRKDFMCAQVLKNGIYETTDGNTCSFTLRAAETETYSSTVNFVSMLYQHFANFAALNGKAPDTTLLNTTLIKKLMADTKFQDTVQKLGIAGLTATQDMNKMVIGRVLNQLLEPLGVALDPDKVDIFEADETTGLITMINKDVLYKAHAGIEYVDEKTGNTDMVATDLFMDTVTKKRPAGTNLFVQSAFSPIVANKNGIYRIDVTVG